MGSVLEQWLARDAASEFPDDDARVGILDPNHRHLLRFAALGLEPIQQGLGEGLSDVEVVERPDGAWRGELALLGQHDDE